MLEAMGVEGFAERARRELRATGETARKRALPSRDEDLTAQEAQIARMARDGLSNPEIGARLFISVRTVQYHLRKVFAKLGISSRAQLDRVLPDGPASTRSR
jgi:DNA-binding CsgD family transcriptional regulator